mgnify:CR=1 FL=1
MWSNRGDILHPTYYRVIIDMSNGTNFPTSGTQGGGVTPNPSQVGGDYSYSGGTTKPTTDAKGLLRERGNMRWEKVLQELSGKLKVSVSVLDRLVVAMENKEPADKYKYVSLLDLEQFVAATNLDTIDVLNIKQQVEQTIEIYRNPEYLKRGYKADPKILKYVDKKWDEWQAAGVNIKIGRAHV